MKTTGRSSRFMHWVRHEISRIITWVIRPKNMRIKAPLTLFCLSFAALSSKGLLFGLQYKEIKLDLHIQDGTLGVLFEIILFFVLFVSLLLLIYEIIQDHKKQSKKKTILLVHEGMDICVTNPLQTIIESKYPNVTPIKINLIPFMEDRSVRDPKMALQETVKKINSAKHILGESNPEDIIYVYGGLASVPLAFVAGYIFSNKNSIDVWDYDRDKKGKDCWHSLDKPPIINIPNFSHTGEVGKEVCLVLPMSFKIDQNKITQKFPGLAVFSATPEEHSNDNMSSYNSQAEMQKKFRQLMIDLHGKGVNKVHVFCAAQASFNFNVGRQIDGNHPECIIYQFEPKKEEQYPWGILLNGLNHSEPVLTNSNGIPELL